MAFCRIMLAKAPNLSVRLHWYPISGDSVTSRANQRQGRMYCIQGPKLICYLWNWMFLPCSVELNFVDFVAQDRCILIVGRMCLIAAYLEILGGHACRDIARLHNSSRQQGIQKSCWKRAPTWSLSRGKLYILNTSIKFDMSSSPQS